MNPWLLVSSAAGMVMLWAMPRLAPEPAQPAYEMGLGQVHTQAVQASFYPKRYLQR